MLLQEITDTILTRKESIASSKLKRDSHGLLTVISDRTKHHEMVVKHLKLMRQKFFMVVTSFFHQGRVSTPDIDTI